MPRLPSRWRAGFTYSHDYDIYAKNAGLTVTDRRLIQTHKDPHSPHFHARPYFLTCKTGEMAKHTEKTADHLSEPFSTGGLKSGMAGHPMAAHGS